MDYFPKVETVEVEHFQLESDSIRDPEDVVCVDGSLIFVNGMYKNYCSVFDLTTGRWQGDYLTKGEGPEEFLNVGNAHNLNGELWLMDNRRKILAHGGKDFQMSRISLNAKSPLISILNAIPISEDLFVVSGIIEGSGCRFMVINRGGDVISKFGEYGELPNMREKKLSDAQNAYIFQVKMDYCPERKMLAIRGCISEESLYLYDMSNPKEPKLVSGFTKYMEAIMDLRGETGMGINNGAITSIVVDIVPVKDYCILLYGCPPKLGNWGTLEGNLVLYMNWKGKPVKGIKLEKSYMNATTDGKKLYLLGLDKETGEYIIDTVPV